MRATDTVEIGRTGLHVTRLGLGGVGRVELAPRLIVMAQLQNRYVDDPHYTDSFRQDLSAWLGVSIDKRSPSQAATTACGSMAL